MSEKILGYQIIRKNVKNINLHIKADGIVYLSVPANLNKYNIERFILSKKNWIDYHINRINNINNENKNVDTFLDKSYIYFLGKKYTLNIEKSDTNKIYFEDNNIYIKTDNIDEKNIKSIVDMYIYYPNAKKIFTKRFNYYLNLMGHINDNITLNIKPLKGKWGVCFPRKKLINLNLYLIKRNELEIDSTIVHEIAHLKYINHNADFYNHISKYLKNYIKKF